MKKKDNNENSTLDESYIIYSAYPDDSLSKLLPDRKHTTKLMKSYRENDGHDAYPIVRSLHDEINENYNEHPYQAELSINSNNTQKDYVSFSDNDEDNKIGAHDINNNQNVVGLNLFNTQKPDKCAHSSNVNEPYNNSYKYKWKAFAWILDIVLCLGGIGTGISGAFEAHGLDYKLSLKHGDKPQMLQSVGFSVAILAAVIGIIGIIGYYIHKKMNNTNAAIDDNEIAPDNQFQVY